MYISKIEISNFRNFSSATIKLNFGLNIIIGHNNSGKTNLLKALQLVFDRDLREKLTIGFLFYLWIIRYIIAAIYFYRDGLNNVKVRRNY